MGSWGTAISSNDTFADIYETFYDYYNIGLTIVEISQRLIDENQEIINDPDDCNSFWFALAKAQWECKELDKELFERIKGIIDSSADLDVWKRLDATEKDLKKRQVVLEKFLLDLQSEKVKAKSRKKKIIRQPLFEKGDCLTLKLENGTYGGAFVLEAIKDSEYGLNLIAITRINQLEKPTTKEFMNAEILNLNYASWDNKPEIGWYYLKSLKSDKVKLKVVGKLEIETKYSPDDHSKGFYFGGTGDKMKEKIERQFESEKVNSKETKGIKLKEMTGLKNKWKLW